MLALTRPDLTLQLTSKVRVAVSFLVSKTGPALSFLSIDRGIVTVCQVTEDGGQVSVATPRGVWGLWGKSRNVAGSWERAWGGRRQMRTVAFKSALGSLWPGAGPAPGLSSSDSSPGPEAAGSLDAAPRIRPFSALETVDLGLLGVSRPRALLGLLRGQRLSSLISCSPIPYLHVRLAQLSPSSLRPAEPVADRQHIRRQLVASTSRSLWSLHFCLLFLCVRAEVRASLNPGPLWGAAPPPAAMVA